MGITNNIIEFVKGSFLIPVMEKYYLRKYSMASPGTKEWLIATEMKYGGIVTQVPRNKVSPKDPRTMEQIRKGGMIGGDRMLHHGYAEKYSKYLLPYIEGNRSVTVVEFGILKGTGIAMWCDLFTDGRILGLDIDLGHINENMVNLKRLGAFKNNRPELYEFDQFEDNIGYLGTILKDDRIDICFDDGLHSTESILNTMKSAMPYLAEESLYFIEDNKDVHKTIRSLYPELLVDSKGELTIVSKIKESNT
nr:hypothetical protein [uncultured Desulfobacter sp.]